MSISNGVRANAENFNNAFMSRTDDTDTTGTVDLLNAGSADVLDAQAVINQNIADIQDNATDIAVLDANKEDKANKDVANGYAGLDGDGRIALSALPLDTIVYKGTYDASTNTPTLADGVGTTGDYYRTSVAGTQDLGSGNIDFAVGDSVIYNGSIWEKQDFAGGVDALTTKGDLLTRDASTEVRLPVGTDGQVLVADSAEASGLKWDDPASGTGSGGINYIENPDAEIDTTGWVEYNDGAVADPVDGTGGATTAFNFTRTTILPLRGAGSFLLNKTGANGQGQGASYDFTIDRADQGKEVYISFDYSNDVNYTTADLGIYIYDVTNAALVSVVNEQSGNLVSTTEFSNQFTASFTSDNTSTSYRLIFHVKTTTATAWNVRIDNIKVGPATESATPVVTDTVFVTSDTLATVNHTSTGNYQPVSFTITDDNFSAYSGSIFTAPKDDYYRISAAVVFGSNATGRRGIQIALTGPSIPSIVGDLHSSGGTGAFGIGATGLVFMNQGDTAEVQCFQDSGISLPYVSQANLSINSVPNTSIYGVASEQNQGSFDFLASQTNQNIPELVFSSLLFSSVTVEYTAITSNNVERSSFDLVFDGTNWGIFTGPVSGTATGISFSVVAGTGQVQYSSGLDAGTLKYTYKTFNQ